MATPAVIYHDYSTYCSCFTTDQKVVHKLGSAGHKTICWNVQKDTTERAEGQQEKETEGFGHRRFVGKQENLLYVETHPMMLFVE